MNHKIKVKPPPLHLKQEETLIGVPATISKPSEDPEELTFQSEVYRHFEGTLTKLLKEDELVPFNLHTAASLGFTSTVRYLIERCHVDVNSRNSGDWTAIMYASLFSHDQTVLYLLEMKADVNVKNPNGKTPLMLAALCGSEDTLRLLIQHGASLEERDNDQFTALMLAIQATHCESAQLLLDHGADPDVWEEIHGQTPLYIAAQTGQFAIARALIAKGVNVNAQTSSGDTAYHAALRNGYSAIANMIAERTSLVNVKTPCPPSAKSNENHLVPLPSHYKPKSPYSAFFERYPAHQHNIPQFKIDTIDDEGPVGHQQWFPHDPYDADVTRRSPEGALETCDQQRDNFNPFNAWPGTSMIFKQAINQRPPFKRSVTKPKSANKTSPVPMSPWTPSLASPADPCAPIKLPKDLSTLLADLGLTKYQIHFEEQDIDLQVFLTMNETDLREIGINSLGARRKCLSTIEYYQTRTNYYRIGEEFQVNTWINKTELAHLKTACAAICSLVDQLRLIVDAPLMDQLVRNLMRVREFFKKY